MAGVEAAGLVLAVLPLLISALEHHKDILMPYKALFRYSKTAQKACQELGLVSTFLSSTLELIGKDCGLNRQEYQAVFKLRGGDAKGIDSTAVLAKEKLIEHFGNDSYSAGLEYLLQRILEDLREIGGDLGLDLGAEAADIQTIWKHVATAKTRLQGSRLERLKKAKEYKDRAILFFKAGTLGSRGSDLWNNVEKLRALRSNAQELGSTVSQKLSFNRDLKEIQKHACSLYNALQAVSTCTAHQSHCIGLRLDRRLAKSNRAISKSETTGHRNLCFNLALAPQLCARDWHSFQVHVDEDEPCSSRPGRHARFADPGPANSWKAIGQSICSSITRSLDVTFGVGSDEQLKEKSATPNESVTLLSSIDSRSIKSLLGQVYGNPPEAVITFQKAIELGLTITASFLQLYSSGWVDKLWSTNDVVQLYGGSTPNLDPIYIRLISEPTASSAASTNSSSVPATSSTASITSSSTQSKTSTDDGTKLLALASMIIELALDQKFEDLRGTRDGPGAYFTVQRCLANPGLAPIDVASPCFREAAEFCRDKYRKDLDLMAEIKPQEIADALVYPFLRDLEHSQE